MFGATLLKSSFVFISFADSTALGSFVPSFLMSFDNTSSVESCFGTVKRSRCGRAAQPSQSATQHDPSPEATLRNPALLLLALLIPEHLTALFLRF
jgi:hypothetical protein